ncbi:hypothetical protein AMR42_15125 [Limnothrix sp. PR1529]|nr:hypothetical protein AMR42_15125 [Limnothrix sp. PR1529]
MHTIALTLTSPQDLRVTSGQAIAPGQIVADRTDDRERLEGQIDRLNLSLSQLRSLPAPMLVKPHPPELPAPDFRTEIAQVRSAELGHQEALAQLAIAQERHDRTVAALPDPVVGQHEAAKLAAAQRAADRAGATLAQARANLAEAQTAYQRDRYAHAQELERSRSMWQTQQLQWAQQQQQRQGAIAQITQQINLARNELSQLETVRSPYGGTVRRVRWLEQTDRSLRAELSIELHRQGDRPKSGNQRNQQQARADRRGDRTIAAHRVD